MNTPSNVNLAFQFPTRAVLALVHFYQRHLSILKPPTCRFYPTCSEYAARAIEAHGLLRGGMLATWRLLRCHPFTLGGYDPVPWEKDDKGRV